MSGCTKPGNPGLQILNPPVVVATSTANAGEFMFSVSVRNTSAQATPAGQFHIMNVAKNFSANPACEIGASNYGQEILEIPALQPNQTWKAADKRMMDIQSFKNSKCSCKVDKCGGGIMRFTLLNANQTPLVSAQSDFEVKWDKGGRLDKNVVTDESLAQ